MKNSDLQEDE